ncbi:MAG TPA: RtcB family protein [Bacteroidia bacterium]|nr:RtcB family protein [Bacteroidia bacterium]
MSKNKIKSKDLDRIGFHRNTSKSVAIILASQHYKHTPPEELLAIFVQVMENPADYVSHEVLGKLAVTFVDKIPEKKFRVFDLQDATAELKVYGRQHIEYEAMLQMEMALRLPVSRQGALMPDAHSGFGLPIGGVLAVENAVIPFGVGVDIGCRMALSIFDLPEKYIEHNRHEMKMALRENTHFGMEGCLEFKQDHDVLDNPAFNETQLLKKLHGKAVRQLGSSGGGNHFVEFGVIELNEANTLGMPAGNYVALLSHSGSRGLGATIARHYTDVAMDVCKLPRNAQHMAWLDLDTEEGQEYWLSMNLAGDYAKACHDRIHINLSRALGIKAVAKVENHHNFAWKENMPHGAEMIVHRKGATPAHKGELGIIPGNMIHGGYLVCGKGIPESLNSASHGAGRKMSRKKAKESITNSGLRQMLNAADVTLIGGSSEESPLAYKDIDDVMQAQQELVDVHGKFTPKIVRMNKE